jgi:hypothetical protein
MKNLTKVAVLLLLFPTVGCYSIWTLNVGSVNKQAANAPTLAQCAALNSGHNVKSGQVTIEAVQQCEAEAKKQEAQQKPK